jgi:hypothetical protein
MKFFTKKAKIIFLAIILVGAILLAYNSLNHNLEYLNLNLNKNGLDGSAINEGFDNPQDTRHASMTSSSMTTSSSPLSGLQEDINNYFHNDEDEDEDKKKKKKNKKSKCYHRYHRHSDCPYYNSDDDNNDDDNSYASSDSYDKFNNNSSLLSGISGTLGNTIMNDFDAKSSYNGSTNNNTSTGMSNGKKAPTQKKKSQIPKGDEDLYILKSEIVPPVCPVCPSVTPCPNKPAPPCPPCGRCPESPFECKKVPNYTNNANGFLPMPVLNDFSTFGM